MYTYVRSAQKNRNKGKWHLVMRVNLVGCGGFVQDIGETTYHWNGKINAKGGQEIILRSERLMYPEMCMYCSIVQDALQRLEAEY